LSFRILILHVSSVTLKAKILSMIILFRYH